jgi:hypothetical protein
VVTGLLSDSTRTDEGLEDEPMDPLVNGYPVSAKGNHNARDIPVTWTSEKPADNFGVQRHDMKMSCSAQSPESATERAHPPMIADLIKRKALDSPPTFQHSAMVSSI